MTFRRLAGRTVAVTRPAGRGRSLVTRLEESGAEVVSVPLIAVEPLSPGGGPLSRALEELDEVDWVVVTSVTAVEQIAVWLEQGQSGRPKWAAVGPVTAAGLESAGVAVSFVPSRHHAEALSEEFPDAPPGGGGVLVVRAEEQRVDIAAALSSKGWSVKSVSAYRTLPTEPSPADLEKLRTADLITVASPSAAANLVRVGVSGVPVVCIGDATAEAARARGLEVAGVAEDPSAAAFTAAVIAAVGLDS